MSKREKIIVILMICSLIYGAYHFSPQIMSMLQGHNHIKPLPPKPKPEIVVLSEKEKYILTRASAPWTSDPFIVSVPRLQKQAKQIIPPAPKDITYSGYLKIGDRIMAVIDRMEYQTGESLLNSQYLISNITPKQIVISLPGGINPVDIPIRDPD